MEYEILSVLGHGGFGITYLARDTLLDEEVAIKEYLPNDLAVRTTDASVRAKSEGDHPDFQSGLEAFLDEARMVARFRHTSIVKVRRFFEQHGTGYIVLDFETGGTLAQRLEKGTPTEAEMRGWLDGILAGLEVLHEKASLHRDLKPNNVMLRQDGVPVLIDFGAARDFRGRRSRSITAIATPGYSPPEQYGVGGHQGPWTDIYALGAILYRAVSGHPPLDSLRRLRNDGLQPAAEAARGRFDKKLLRVIDWMLRIDEADRPASVADLRSALESGRIPPAGNTREAGSAGSETAGRKRRWAAAAALMTVVLALGYGGYALWLDEQPEAGEPQQVALESPVEPLSRDQAQAPSEADGAPPPLSDAADDTSAAEADSATTDAEPQQAEAFEDTESAGTSQVDGPTQDEGTGQARGEAEEGAQGESAPAGEGGGHETAAQGEPSGTDPGAEAEQDIATLQPASSQGGPEQQAQNSQPADPAPVDDAQAGAPPADGPPQAADAAASSLPAETAPADSGGTGADGAATSEQAAATIANDGPPASEVASQDNIATPEASSAPAQAAVESDAGEGAAAQKPPAAGQVTASDSQAQPAPSPEAAPATGTTEADKTAEGAAAAESPAPSKAAEAATKPAADSGQAPASNAEPVKRPAAPADIPAQAAPSAADAAAVDKLAALPPMPKSILGSRPDEIAAPDPARETRPEDSAKPDAKGQTPLPAEVDEPPAARAAPAPDSMDELDELDRELDRELEALQRRVREQLAELETQLYQAAGDSREALEVYLERCATCTFKAEAEQRLARLDPAPGQNPDAAEEPPVPADPRALASAIQNELKRVGCYPGSVDGIWGPASRKAMSDFGRHASVELASLEPEGSALRLLGRSSTRICPLVCDARHEIRGDACVLKTCPRGQVLSNRGTCSAPVRNRPAATRKPQKKSSSNCFVFNGVRECG